MALASFTETEGQKGEVEVFFNLDSKGRLLGEPKVISSTNSKLDQIAVNCVKSASPFQSFPQGLNKKGENFSLRIILGASSS